MPGHHYKTPSHSIIYVAGFKLSSETKDLLHICWADIFHWRWYKVVMTSELWNTADFNCKRIQECCFHVMLGEEETQQDQRRYQKYQVRGQGIWEWFCGNSSMEDSFQPNTMYRKNVLSTSLEHVRLKTYLIWNALVLYVAEWVGWGWGNRWFLCQGLAV